MNKAKRPPIASLDKQKVCRVGQHVCWYCEHRPEIVQLGGHTLGAIKIETMHA